MKEFTRTTINGETEIRKWNGYDKNNPPPISMRMNCVNHPAGLTVRSQNDIRGVIVEINAYQQSLTIQLSNDQLIQLHDYIGYYIQDSGILGAVNSMTNEEVELKRNG